MIFFNRLFGIYYFFYCRIRKFDWFHRAPDRQAVNVVATCQMLLIIVVCLPLRDFLSDSIRHVFLYIWWMPLPVLLYADNRYYRTNKERQEALIDKVRYMSKGPKIFWKLIAVLTPIGLFTLLMIELWRYIPSR